MKLNFSHYGGLENPFELNSFWIWLQLITLMNVLSVWHTHNTRKQNHNLNNTPWMQDSSWLAKTNMKYSVTCAQRLFTICQSFVFWIYMFNNTGSLTSSPYKASLGHRSKQQRRQNNMTTQPRSRAKHCWQWRDTLWYLTFLLIITCSTHYKTLIAKIVGVKFPSSVGNFSALKSCEIPNSFIVQ